MAIPLGNVCRCARGGRHWGAIAAAVSLLLFLPKCSLADSYAGSDWLVNLTGYLHGPLTMSGKVDKTDVATTIGQTDATHIDIPLYLPELSLDLGVPGTVDGTHITATAYLAGPISVTVDGADLLLYGITAQLEGDATGINALDTSGGFGPRVYEITGCPTNGAGGTSFVKAANVRKGTLSLGSVSVDIDSWNATRDIGVVPEPGTLAMLLALATGLAGFGWRRRQSSATWIHHLPASRRRHG
jgi:hypothetical protein